MRIWTGRAGSGKTTAMLAEIAEKSRAEQGRQVLLVPELNSHQMERRLAAATDNHGARTAEVLTFSRLADRVFAEVGGLAQQTLTPAGQLLTLQQAARRVQSGLSVWSGLADKPELLREALRLVDECKTCAVPPEKLFEAAEESADEALSAKLTDLAQLLTAYDRLCEQSLPDPRDRLTRLRDGLADSRALDGASVYLDGFLGFTPQELDVIDAILALGAPLSAAVTCDLAYPEIFVTGCKTVKTLTRMAKRHNRAVERLALGESKIARPADLAAIEAESLLPVHAPRPAEGRGVRLYAAASPFDECEHAAAYIRRKVRDEGARYRDFVVTARDIEPYGAFLAMAMARYDVPVFLAEKPDLLSRPPMALVTGALEAAQSYFRYEDLFACLKTGLTAVTRDETDKLENYVLTWNIRGGAWERDWTEHPDGYGLPFDERSHARLDELNALRQKAAAPFSALRDRLKGEKPASDCVRALYEFLLAVGAPQRMADRAAAHEAAGRLQLADEYRQLWEILVSAMEQFAWVCGETPLSAERFAQLFRLVLGEYDVGAIPVSLDRVTCGNIERACGENAKYVILLGVNDGLIPKAASGVSLLSDLDRDKLDALGVELKASGAERLLMEQETLYRALACPTEALLLSYHTLDAAGGEARPSYFVSTVKSLLPGVPFASHQAEHAADRLQAERPAVEAACAYLSGDRTAAVRAAYAYYQDDARVLEAARQRRGRGPLTSPHTIDGLYGKAMNLTASRVDTFYSCRFAFFMQYGLKAKPRRAAKFDALETGTFIHYVLEHALDALARREGGAAAADGQAARRVCRAAVRQYVEQELGGLETKTARFRYLFGRLARTVEQILDNVLEELRVSDFAPIDYEVDFSRGGDLPPVTCERDGETVSLSGKVDRVDGYIKNGRLYLRVMDYKSGKKSFSLSDIWHGLNMQLIIYLYALQEQGLERYRERLTAELNEIVPAGVLYVPVRDELPDAPRDIDEDALRALRDKALRRSGLLSDDMELLEAMERGLDGDGRFIPVSVKVKKGEDEPSLSAKSAVAGLEKFGRLARYTHEKLLQMGQELRAGSVIADPCKKDKNSVYCDWCDFRAACRFDETAGDKARYLKHLTDEEFWQQVGGER
ncbi:MAG: PD-(D/E)XK nuclease family protein [Eubacteriales bacterium]|nr:PD-(D/E)XK nuclease family protein [Eubacteriales bacterium]